MTGEGVLRSAVWPAAWRGFARAFILLGLPLIAWGLGDVRGFLSNPTRAAFAAAVLVLASLHGWLAYRTPQQPKLAEAEPRSTRLLWHSTLFEVLLILVAFGDRRDLSTWADIPALRWIGLAIYLLGAVLSIWAGATWVSHLRREGADAVDVPALLHEGPFRWIRYPTLLSLLLYSVGAVLIFRSWIGLALLAPLIAVVASRSAVLDHRHADRYRVVWPGRSYRSKRIIPYLF